MSIGENCFCWPLKRVWKKVASLGKSVKSQGIWIWILSGNPVSTLKYFSELHTCDISLFRRELPIFLAHLSLRLTGELIGYQWIRRPASSSDRPSVHIFKHLLIRNCLANQSQILCGASLGRGNESLYKWSRSHDQDGRHAHIW